MCKIRAIDIHNQETIIECLQDGKLFPFGVSDVNNQSIDSFFLVISQSIKLETIRWHNKLGHINFQSFQKMQNQQLILGFSFL
jgi:hypothetical protein